MLFSMWRVVMDYFNIISKYFQRWSTRGQLLTPVAVKNRPKVTPKICTTPRNFELTQNVLSRSQILPRQQISGSMHAENLLKPRKPIDFRLSPCFEGSGYGPLVVHGPPTTHSPSIQLDYVKYFCRSAAIGLFEHYFNITCLGQRVRPLR